MILQPKGIFCCRFHFNVLLSSSLVGLAMSDKSLDKVVDTLLEKPANQGDEDEEAEDEHHQVDCGRGHLEMNILRRKYEDKEYFDR
ncbi:hypothetical protein CFAM422_012916 [Trichoderma lentiforme]|uniref:Uncharacterized protein n=1 Tax=Trichoderma lentiforme TaxID=1567552 RepID=A0A9P4X1N7_9HYPO|nr:hypothetical protein CFAM422_012916 [Trichoderma lentiforme]